MARWPSASSYPGTPKAYPATPKAYPATPNAYPAAAGSPESRASSSMGVFSSANYLSTATALDFAVSVTMGSSYEITSRTGNQTIWGLAGTAGGWQEQFSNTTHALFFTGGTTMTYAEGAPAIGVNTSINTRLAGGAVRGSRNGATAVQRNAAPTYVAVTGTPAMAMGRHGGGTASPMAASRLLWTFRLGREATDAELQEWTDQVNLLDRYLPPASLVAAVEAQNALVPGSSWIYVVHTDYVAANPTSVASIGSGPTWTKNGTIAKNAIEEEIEHEIQLTDWHCNVLDVETVAQSSGPTYRRGNPFREFRFTTDATRFVVKGICDFSGVTNLNNLGLRQDATTLSALVFDRFSVWRRLDVMGLSGSHDYRLVDGSQAVVGGVSAGVYNSTAVRAVTSVLVQAPASATFTVAAPAPAANRLVVMGDSFTVGQAATVASTTESEVMLLRSDYPGDVIAFCGGSFAHWHFLKDATTYNAFIADLATAFAGATSKRVLDLLGTNDQGFHTTFYVDRADFRAKVGAGFDAINAADSAVRLHVRTACLRTGAYEGSTVTDATPTSGTGGGTAVGGVILQNNRDDMATVTSTRTGYILTTRNGVLTFPFFAPSSNHGSDNFHPSGWTGGVASGGHNTIYLDAKAQLAGASDSVGSGY